MIVVKKYKTENKHVWDSFIKVAKNSHFMFYRDYMEYHSERFEDYSLLFMDEKDRLVAVLPANINENTLFSHQGLTFGGLILTERTSTNAVLDIFSTLKVFLSTKNIRNLIYKPIPYIYTVLPSDEDLYALFVNDAHIVRRDVSSLINLNGVIKYTKGRKWTINKAKKSNINLCETDDFNDFWVLLSTVLQSQHGTEPVHSISEIHHLRKLFPENIKLFTANYDGKVIAGAVIYEAESVIHTQYLSNSDIGRELGALDLLLDHLIKNKYKDKKYFDFGISTESGGQILNKGLIGQKEGFGARAMVHDVYQLEIK